MAIQVMHLSKHYPGGVKALRDVSFILQPGVTGLLGPNGAGKSTLINLLVGLLNPSEGEIAIDGEPLMGCRETLYTWLGYLPQQFTPYPSLTVYEFLDYMAMLKGLESSHQRRARIDAVLGIVHMEEYRRRRSGTLSGGLRQRLGIAQALLNDPEILILDEPTAGLDPDERMSFRTWLAGMARRRTVLFSSHIVSDLAATCERLLILEQGELLYDGAPAALQDRARGHVWEVQTPAAELESLSSTATVVNARKEGSQVIVRVIAPAGPCPWPAGSVEPTLEDAYVCIRAGARI